MTRNGRISFGQGGVISGGVTGAGRKQSDSSLAEKFCNGLVPGRVILPRLRLMKSATYAGNTPYPQSTLRVYSLAMIVNGFAKAKGPARTAHKTNASGAHRILVVEDEPLMRALNSRMLKNAGYAVDTAEDGAAAWDTLQAKAYDLVITDHNMPKVTGLELIEKARTAGMTLPIIMATGEAPEEVHSLQPPLQPAAVLLKPYTITEFLGTVRDVLYPAVSIALTLFCAAVTSNAQEVPRPVPLPPTGLHFVSPNGTVPSGLLASYEPGKAGLNGEQSPPTALAPLPPSNTVMRLIAMTLSVRGECAYSDRGATFAPLERNHNLEQGAFVRTGKDGRADLFFRRTGTTICLQPGTEIVLEQMTVTMKDGLPVVYTLLDLHQGRIFTVVRSKLAGSQLEIKNAAGRSVVEGSGVGRYIITADGTHVSAKGSAIPLKVIGENGITVIAAGQQFDQKDGKMLPVKPSSWVNDIIQEDELQAATEEFRGP
jgi:CheY-like chemotaxis protein